MTGNSNEIANSHLEVILLKRTFVLPWSQFLFAEGGDEEIRLAFSTHDVMVTGSRLGKLLENLSAQKLSRLEDPSRSERFVTIPGPQIISILVKKLD